MKINPKILIAIGAFIAGILINRYFNLKNTNKIIATLTDEIHKIQMNNTNHLSYAQKERINTLQEEIDLIVSNKPKSLLNNILT